MLEDYNRARKLALKQVRRDVAAGVYPYVTALDDILKGRGSQGEVAVGTMEIDLALVAGTRTRGRQNAFSRSFLPLPEPGSEFSGKWIALFDSQVEEGFREPIQVFEYLQRFYVQEGNKRVSVARYLGAPTIAARVSRVVPMAEDEQGWALYQAFSRFWRVCPLYGVIVSSPGAYARLAKLVGRDLDEPWPEELVRSLRALLVRFSSSYRAHEGEQLGLEVGDAFIVFLSACGFTAALDLTASGVDEMVQRLRPEFLVAAGEAAGESIAYLEDPAPKGSTIAELTGIARSAVAAKSLSKPFGVAFIYDDDPARSGWDALHEQGRLELERRLGATVETRRYLSCAEDAAFSAAVEDAARAGSDLVVTVQPTQMDQSLRAAVAYPNMAFLNCSISLSRSAVRTFGCRLYEVKFLMGVLAAALADGHRVGYVAESPVYGTVAEVNAFAIGAAMVDPQVKVHLVWLSCKDYNWQRDLKDAGGVRVICGRDNQDPTDAGRPWGLFCVEEDGSCRQLARPVWDWGRYYELMVRSIKGDAWRREGRANPDRALNYWWGMAAGVVDVELLDGVPRGPRELVALLRQSVLSHRADPFAGELVAQGGTVVQEAGAGRLQPEQIIRMDWLAENVVGRLPEASELVPASVSQVEVAGLIPLDDSFRDSPFLNQEARG